MKPILFSSLLLTACAADEPTPRVSETSQAERGGDDNEEQGRYLLSKFADPEASNGWHFWVGNLGITSTASVSVSVTNDRLVATHSNGTAFTDNDFVGMQFTLGTHPLRIDAVIKSTDGEVGYQLSFHDGTGWTAYCDSTTGSEAVPMQGRWTIARDHFEGSELSFSCQRGGVAAKCIEWEYDPETSGRNVVGSEWRLHQTCVQHASAAYCNNGIARTRELTPIAIRDWVDGRKSSPDEAPLPTLDPALAWPPPDKFYVEGVWEYDQPVVCFTKFRWSQLPPGGHCPQAVPDPRTIEGRAAGGRFCDELSLADLQQNGALFQTGSMVMDIYAHAWVSTSGDRVATVAGYVENGVAVSTPFPAEGYQLVTGGPSFVLLRNLPGSLDPVADVIPVYMQHNSATGDRVVAPIDPVTGAGVTANHTVDMSRPEGYLLKQSGPSLAMLKLFKDGGNYVTALANPGGYSFVRNLGFVVP